VAPFVLDGPINRAAFEALQQRLWVSHLEPQHSIPDLRRKMVTRAERLADFTTDADPASQALVEVLCADHVGTYLLPFLCRRTPEGFRNERTGELIERRIVGWREPKPKAAARPR